MALGLFDESLIKRVENALDEMYQAILRDEDLNLSSYQLPVKIEQLLLSFYYQRDLAREWLLADPAKTLSKVSVPVLIIQGTADIQVEVDDALLLAAALPEGQRELFIFDDVDHILKKTYGQPLSYVDPDRSVEPEILETIADWILRMSE
ncbi:MAG: alpha/beta hydrolase [Firmicutes bacterium]|nr:alpha/beta hydrolase [Bacillota bacterium]